MREKNWYILLGFSVLLAFFLFIANSIQLEAASKSAKLYKAAKKEKNQFIKEAEYYGYTITKDKLISKTSKKVKWQVIVENYDPALNSDGIECSTFNAIMVTKLDTFYDGRTGKDIKAYDTEYYDGMNPIGDREIIILLMKEDSLAFSIHRMLEQKSLKAAKSLRKNIIAKAGTTSEITSKYVKSDKTGRSNFTATTETGKKYKISVRYHRGKKRGQIIAKYYLNNKASTKKKILKKF